MTSRYGVEVRAATPADALGIAMLMGTAGPLGDARELGERLGVLRHSSGIALIAVQWGPPCGLVVLHWYPTLEDARPTAQITTLIVDVEERRRGIGRLLLKAASQAARMAGCAKLEVLAGPGDPALHAFCRATGFTDAGPSFVRSLRKQG